MNPKQTNRLLITHYCLSHHVRIVSEKLSFSVLNEWYVGGSLVNNNGKKQERFNKTEFTLVSHQAKFVSLNDMHYYLADFESSFDVGRRR